LSLLPLFSRQTRALGRIVTLCRLVLLSVVTGALVASYAACSSDYGQPPLADWGIADGSVAQITVDEPIVFAARSETTVYGLPRAGEPGIADLIAVLPDGAISLTEPNLFVADGDVPSGDQCQGGGAVIAPGLPMVVEGVVTLHPRQYVKTPICGQDERFYGSFVVEDDTGGILVLRDGRVADFTFGDRVRLTVRGMTVTFGRDPETRAVLIADIEPLTSGGGTVLYREQTGRFAAADVGLAKRIEGWVLQRPTNDNFNSMLIADRPVPAATDAEVTPTCIEICTGSCNTICPSDRQALCRQQLCPPVCASVGNQFNNEAVALLPGACWEVGIDSELGRRGFSPPLGAHVEIIGPVASSFGRKIWMHRLGQIRFLD
jgi:hypothetical protein